MSRHLGEKLLAWFAGEGRHLPWRDHPLPYEVVISEFMLQQTQVERVLPIFTAFTHEFPDFARLAAAPRSAVVRAWKGLGYNSRALRLHELARAVVRDHGGILPRDAQALRALPGIGPYTASAVRAFAFNLDEVPVDTNVRRVTHRVVFGLEFPVPRPARAIEAAASAWLVVGRARELGGALMDLGATLCTARAPKCHTCPLREMCAAAPIDPKALAAARSARRVAGAPVAAFETTARFARGRIVDALRALPAGEGISLLDLHAQLAHVSMARTRESLTTLLERLASEGLIQLQDGTVALADA